jgi:hypothetical protein
MLTHLEPRLFADTQGSRLVGSLSAVKARAPVLGGTSLYQRLLLALRELEARMPASG